MIFSAIALNRAMAVFSYRTASKWFSWKRTGIMVAIICTFAAIILMLPLTGNWGRIEKAGCIYHNTVVGGTGPLGPLQMLMALTFFPSVIMLVTVNIYIQYHMRKNVGQIQAYLARSDITAENRAHNERAAALEKNFSRTVFFMMIWFVLMHFISKIFFFLLCICCFIWNVIRKIYWFVFMIQNILFFIFLAFLI